MSVPMSAQVSALRHIVQKCSPHTLKAGGFALRTSEAEMLRERLIAALRTLEQVEDRQ